MSHALPVISGRDAVKKFARLGYAVVRQRGSHIRLEHASDKVRKKLTVPDHKTLGPGLLRKLIRDAEITVDEFNES
ncbi:MAG: type II toxin-antitoxin system HicA family toxin [Candidatus Altiarchaeota archaeon]